MPEYIDLTASDVHSLFPPEERGAAQEWMSRHGQDPRDVVRVVYGGGRFATIHRCLTDNSGHKILGDCGCCLAVTVQDIDVADDPPPWGIRPHATCTT